MGVTSRFYEKTEENKDAQVFTESRGKLLYALNLGPRAAERAISTLVDFGLVERLARPASGRQATYRLRVAERYETRCNRQWNGVKWGVKWEWKAQDEAPVTYPRNAVRRWREPV